MTSDLFKALSSQLFNPLYQIKKLSPFLRVPEVFSSLKFLHPIHNKMRSTDDIL